MSSPVHHLCRLPAGTSMPLFLIPAAHAQSAAAVTVTDLASRAGSGDFSDEQPLTLEP